MERNQFVYIGIIVAMYSLFGFTMGTGFSVNPWITTVMLILMTFFATMIVFKKIIREDSQKEVDENGQE